MPAAAKAVAKRAATSSSSCSGVAVHFLLGFSRKHQLPKQVFGDMVHMLIPMNQACAALAGSGGNQRIDQRQAFGCGTGQVESGESQPFINCHHVIDEQPLSLGSLASFSITRPKLP